MRNGRDACAPSRLHARYNLLWERRREVTSFHIEQLCKPCKVKQIFSEKQRQEATSSTGKWRRWSWFQVFCATQMCSVFYAWIFVKLHCLPCNSQYFFFFRFLKWETLVKTNINKNNILTHKPKMSVKNVSSGRVWSRNLTGNRSNFLFLLGSLLPL